MLDGRGRVADLGRCHDRQVAVDMRAAGPLTAAAADAAAA